MSEDVIYAIGNYFENENVRMLFEYSQAIVKKDKTRIVELDARYHLNEDVIYAIGKFVDIREAKEKLVKEVREEIKMCELFDDIREEGREEGRACGVAMTLRMLNYQAEDIIIYLVDNLKLTREEAMKYI